MSKTNQVIVEGKYKQVEEYSIIFDSERFINARLEMIARAEGPKKTGGLTLAGTIMHENLDFHLIYFIMSCPENDQFKFSIKES